LDLDPWIEIGRPPWIGAEQVALAAAQGCRRRARRRRIAGVLRLRDSGPDSTRVLLWEHACGMANASRAAARAKAGGAALAATHGGRAATASYLA